MMILIRVLGFLAGLKCKKEIGCHLLFRIVNPYQNTYINNMSYVSLIFCLQTLKLVRAAKDIQFLVHYAKNYFQIDCGRRYQEPEKD